jgi:transcription elongation GreA/GreB family factor
MGKSATHTEIDAPALVNWLTELQSVAGRCDGYIPDPVSGVAPDWAGPAVGSSGQLALMEVADDRTAALAAEIAGILRQFDGYQKLLVDAMRNESGRRRLRAQLDEAGMTPSSFLLDALAAVRSCRALAVQSWHWEARWRCERVEHALAAAEARNAPLEARERLVDEMRVLGRPEVTLESLVTVSDQASGESWCAVVISGARRRGPSGLEYLVEEPGNGYEAARTDAPLGRALLGRFVGDVVVVCAPGGDSTYRIDAVTPMAPRSEERDADV